MQFPRIRDLREDRDMNQKEIAQLLRVTQQQYSLYETGKREIPMSMCIVLAKFYNVSLDYIAGLTNNKGGIGYDKKYEQYEQSGNNIAIMNFKKDD